MAVTVYYDGDCPFCARYVTLVRLREAAGPVALVDLRSDPVRRQALEAEGFDLDLGMVVETDDGRRMAGDEAMTALSLMSTPSGIANRLSAAIFSRPWLAAVLYPVLRAGRNLTLLLLGRVPIAGLDQQVMAKFGLFAAAFAIFSLFQVVIYLGSYQVTPSWDIGLIGLSAAALLMWPQSIRLFLFAVAVALISAWIRAPALSNHTMLKNVVLVGFVVTFAVHLLRGSRWDRIFTDFAAVGTGALAVMYVFGIFHKINTGFLDPAMSCAIALWSTMPPPLVWLQTAWMHQLAIWGTFIVEGLILVALFIRPVRYYGVLAGIGFHVMLALAGYAMYFAFSSLVIALHFLVLAPATAARASATPIAQLTLGMREHPVRLIVALGITALALVAARVGDYTLVTLLGLLLIGPLCVAVIAVGPDREAPHLRISRPGWALAVGWTTLFFVVCLTPYMGLRTGQSMNMFANLRVEGGVSNHLVFREPWGLFPYAGDLVEVTEGSGSRALEFASERGLMMTWYAFLNDLDRHPAARASFRRDGMLHEDQSAETLAAEIAETLHPPWVRKFLPFRFVHPEVPPPCGN